ncbi:MAG: hypothetical protein HEQ15_06840 [Betaproteobacteria bacterium]
MATAGAWFYRNWQDRRKEERKDVRNSIDAIVKLIEEVETAADAYYAAAADDVRCPDLAHTIRTKTKYIGRKVHQLTLHLGETNLAGLSFRFRQAVSGGDFDSAERAGRPASAPIFSDIAAAATRLTDEMERAFKASFDN